MAASGSFLQLSASNHIVSKRKGPKGQEMAKKGASDERSKSWSNNRFLITINIMGSSGPIRFVVNEKDAVCDVIEAALKSYAREGRLPVLGSDATNFFLYCADAGFDELSPSEPIGSYGTRNFVLCKKLASPTKTEARSKLITRMGSGGWKWLSKSFKF